MERREGGKEREREVIEGHPTVPVCMHMIKGL